MKPILFNTAMVRAILDNRKTVTRRVVKIPHCGYFEHDPPLGVIPPCCHGDILYVREVWAPGYEIPHMKIPYSYKADNNDFVTPRWHPSIYMPRKAARIFLRVKDVRVERLQDITELDILEKEGVTVDFPEPKPSYVSLAYTETRLKPAVRKAFADLWDSTIKPAGRAIYGWDANPWVWVIKFERISKKEAGSWRK